MIDPRDTQENYDYTVMGPGFFVFFSNGIERVAGWFDYPDRPPFKARTKEEKRAKPVIEEIAQKIESGLVDTREDLEIALRLRLQQREIVYKKLYKQYLEKEFQKAKRRKRRNRAISLLLLT